VRERLRCALHHATRGDKRFIKFLAVGVINTLFGYAVFAGCLWLGLQYSVAIGIATVLGTLFNFKSTGSLVFRSHDSSRLFRFIGVYVIVYCANVAGIFILLKIGINAYVGGLLLILPLAVLAYYLNAQYVFNKK